MPSASSCFLLFFVSEKLFGEVSRNQLKIYMNYFYEETKTEPGGDLQGGPTGPRQHPGAVNPLTAAGPTWASRAPPRVALSPINRLRPENPRYPIIFSIKHPRPPPSPTLDREGSETLPGTLPEGEIVTGGIYTTMPTSGVMRE